MENNDYYSTKPNWDYWRKMKIIPLYKAILLSFDLEPREEYLHEFKSDHDNNRRTTEPDTFKFRNGPHQKRYEIIASHLKSNEPFQFFREPISGFEKYEVDLIEFGRMVKEMGIEIPRQFPIDTAKATKDRSSGAEKYLVELPYLTDELSVVFEAMKVVHAAGINGTKLLESTLEKAFADAGIDLPKVAINQFAIMIRPDDVAFADPRSRKKPKRQHKHKYQTKK